MTSQSIPLQPLLRAATRSDTLDFVLSAISPQFSLKRHMARLLAIREECPGTHTLLLQPGARWGGFIAGQHVGITVDVNGVRYRRTYSLSCSPQYYERYGHITLTIKSVADGRVSPRLAEVLQVGSYLEISAVSGEFVWQDDKQVYTEKTLMLAAGSGITPIRSLLDELCESRPQQDLVLLVYVRHAGELIFGQWLENLPSQLRHLRVEIRYTDQDGEITPENLLAACPDLAEREIYLCGPQGFMDNVRQSALDHGAQVAQIHQESFGSRPQRVVSSGPATVRFQKSGKSIRSTDGKTLLELAELAGLSPKYGCRSGICHECKCQRGSGSLIHAVTGQPIPDEQQQVQACVVIPDGDVTINSL